MNKIKVKCKPTYQFQSIEFEWEVDLDEDLELTTMGMFNFYNTLLQGLIKIAPTQDSKEPFEPATAKQLEILKKFKLSNKQNISKQEATILIQKSLKKDH